MTLRIKMSWRNMLLDPCMAGQSTGNRLMHCVMDHIRTTITHVALQAPKPYIKCQLSVLFLRS